MVPVQIQTLGRESGGQASILNSQLAMLGVTSGEAGRDVPLLFLHDQVTEDVLEIVRAAQVENRYVLAIYCGLMETSHARRWQLLAAGAGDVLLFGGDPAAIAKAINNRVRRWQEVDRLAASPAVSELATGQSPAWRRAIREVVEIAAFTASAVLITGESGTGKELMARLIHQLDRRASKPEMVLLDCSAITPELSGSEFFGHEKGSYTGSIASREGAFAQADKGTLFLDEVGELPLPLQAQLLRAVQERTYKKLGSNVWRETDFRLVCATNRDLQADISAGAFRRDLYYRIASVTCHLPPLRERTEDILPLARVFLHQCSAAEDFDGPVASYLVSREYSGNVRDLRQIVHRIAYRHSGGGLISLGDIPAGDLPAEMVPPDWRDSGLRKAVQKALTAGSGLKDIGRAAENMAEEIALEEEGGNLQRAAARLKITDRALQMRRHGRKEQAAAG